MVWSPFCPWDSQEFSPALVWCYFGFMCWVTHVVFRHLSLVWSPGSPFGNAGAECSRGMEGDGIFPALWRSSPGLVGCCVEVVQLRTIQHSPLGLTSPLEVALLLSTCMSLGPDHEFKTPLLGWKLWITDEIKITYSGKSPIPKLKTEELSGCEVLMNLYLSTYIFAQILQMPIY